MASDYANSSGAADKQPCNEPVYCFWDGTGGGCKCWFRSYDCSSVHYVQPLSKKAQINEMCKRKRSFRMEIRAIALSRPGLALFFELYDWIYRIENRMSLPKKRYDDQCLGTGASSVINSYRG